MNMAIPITGMAKGGSNLSSFQGATLEKTKPKLDQPKKSVQEPKVDNSGGGGNIGKNISNGGGGDGDDGDDDDYFDEFGDGDGSGDSDKFFRTVITQLYTKEAIEAVLGEFFRSVTDLPAIIRQQVMMGLFSSAQLVRFLSMDVRPNVTRAVTRTMPAGVCDPPTCLPALQACISASQIIVLVLCCMPFVISVCMLEVCSHCMACFGALDMRQEAIKH